MILAVVQFFRVFFGLIFLFFVPGFAFSLVLFPKKEELSLTLRLGLSGALSVIFDVLITLFIDLVLHIPTTPVNIFTSLLIFTLACLAVWRLEVLILTRKREDMIQEGDSLIQK
ncbi:MULTISPECIES: DUF1616 domain-containing protein [unclassified Archaeoglobus]|uniref:DUF1616 domain-containing protein n=1 Tax=unclassified Archaeoglobus TaxID=2643606 RepID=UPI0025BBEC9F|nr:MULTISPECIES: DUF1616 domain-containing protein [unclassified Archaeoglobus]